MSGYVAAKVDTSQRDQYDATGVSLDRATYFAAVGAKCGGSTPSLPDEERVGGAKSVCVNVQQWWGWFSTLPRVIEGRLKTCPTTFAAESGTVI
jgi:hypothetical protein